MTGSHKIEETALYSYLSISRHKGYSIGMATALTTAKTKHSRIKEARAHKLNKLLTELARRSGDANLGSVQFIDMSAAKDGLDAAAISQLTNISIEVLTEFIVEPDIFYQQNSMQFAAVFVKADKATALQILENCSREILARLGRHDLQLKSHISVEEVTTSRLLALSRAHMLKIAETSAQSDLAQEVLLGPGESLELRFRPFWRPKQGAFGPYLMSAKRTFPDGRSDFGYSTLPDRQNLRRVANYDLTLLQFAATEVEHGLANDQDYGVVCPIYYPSYASPKLCKIYKKYLERLPDQVRRRLSLQIVGLGARFDGRQIARTLYALSTLCGGVMVHLPLKSEGYVALGGGRILAIGTSVYGADLSNAKLENSLRNFLRSISGVQAAPYLTGVNSEAVGRLAQDLGFKLLGGPGVVVDAAHPTPPLEAPWTRQFEVAS